VYIIGCDKIYNSQLMRGGCCHALIVILQVTLQRNRRQFENLRRSNFARLIGPILALNDPEACAAACMAYAQNERNDAGDSPVRGPDRRNKYLRSGGTSLTRRFNSLFGFLENICMGGFCNRIPSE
jgi:hypothetical protein